MLVGDDGHIALMDFGWSFKIKCQLEQRPVPFKTGTKMYASPEIQRYQTGGRVSQA